MNELLNATVELSGTYEQAQTNVSIDYLAIQFPLNNMRQQTYDSNGNFTVLLGNETNCSNETICNKQLKPDTKYIAVIGACITDLGCTHALSRIFITKPKPVGGKKSYTWVVIFPLLVIAVISVGLLYWKRKVIKEWFDHKKGSISNVEKTYVTMPYIITPKKSVS
ncbi:unnamed protein product [Didymodactylos carnosus]|uniref:PTPRJ transmembrane domain-containing protein n=1 Tax=Didymodactylos carnosus TaxID=1234261 RepID=A0A8S2IB13_9BILA|nr:unnamed protein product [Didymodactylos carnosus]CAF3715890.1 unnamed protein product [Didymodactylos carnosus]